MTERRLLIIVAMLASAVGLFFMVSSLRWYTPNDPGYNATLAVASFLFALVVLQLVQRNTSRQ
jgi:hypothetical protein